MDYTRLDTDAPSASSIPSANLVTTEYKDKEALYRRISILEHDLEELRQQFNIKSTNNQPQDQTMNTVQPKEPDCCDCCECQDCALCCMSLSLCLSGRR